ncbi:hypothetical protein [Stappia sp. ES.058]|uniref:DUF6949 family protein n=1 Tax=Stappia sp. ES.058 TaxID=1881061 RepID=UPI00087C137A|nr:hypothetical protein [Stappia sp. ES.058]SDU22049.1 hypothetical protein SAMN05428979_2355 [Stappia sp. ES.058]
MSELALAAYIGCAGFVMAGILGSFYQLLTGEPLKFAISVETWVKGVFSCLLCVFAGPFIIMRNAIRGRRLDQRPIGWLVASSTIAGMWSLCSGVFVLQIAFTILL